MKRCLVVVALLLMSLGVKAAENDSLMSLEYQWVCDNELRECSLSVDSQLLNYYRNDRVHEAYQFDDTPFNTPSTYSSFMFSEYDRNVIRRLVEQCCTRDSTEVAHIRSALTFVQSLPYVSDMESMGVNEYVRYPLETLADGEGDCEDKVVLLAAMLKEMGIDFVLFVIPDHLALGVHSDSLVSNQYFLINDRRYYYVETTTPNWEIGAIPREFSKVDFQAVSCDTAPALVSRKMSFQSDTTVMFEKAHCHVTLKLFNMGPGKATHVRLHVELLSMGRRRNELMMSDVFPIADLDEGEEREETIEFKSLIHDVNQVRMTLYADGVPDQRFEMRLQQQMH